jgi:DNA replication licensing factor MCM3
MFSKREKSTSTLVSCRASNVIPIYDDSEKRNPLSFEYGLSDYKDLQHVTLQEMPEKVPAGLLSRSVEVVLQDDLVDQIKPGDRVQINGVLRPLVNGQTFSSGTFRTTLVATSVTLLQAPSEGNLAADDVKKIKEVARNHNMIELLVTSLAPSVFGHDDVKKGCVLQLVGGQEKVLSSSTRLRGDINMLLIGDPSTAKSQMLRHMLNLAPLSFNTTGRGSSGVGLTAAVTLDKETGEKQLEAGAMVLADRGLICIDEFDKMSPEDRVAMHEVMEQQTVTIAKAGIHVSLNARCSVLAAANPIYGEFIKEKPVNVNIGYRYSYKTP